MTSELGFIQSQNKEVCYLATVSKCFVSYVLLQRVVWRRQTNVKVLCKGKQKKIVLKSVVRNTEPYEKKYLWRNKKKMVKGIFKVFLNILFM